MVGGHGRVEPVWVTLMQFIHCRGSR